MTLSAWIKDRKLSNFRFEWQKGYGAFSHSRSQLEAVTSYIMNQETHHQKKIFRNEYLEILSENDIEFNSEYLFEFFDNTYC